MYLIANFVWYNHAVSIFMIFVFLYFSEFKYTVLGNVKMVFTQNLETSEYCWSSYSGKGEIIPIGSYISC